MKRVLAATAAGGLALATAFMGAASASAADTATVYVVHGIPDLPVDVYVNGALTLDDFQPETVAGPLDLASMGATHASEMFARNVFNFVQLLLVDGALAPDWSDELLAKTVWPARAAVEDAAA